MAHASQWRSFSASLPGGNWDLAEEEERWGGEGEIAAFCQSRWSQNKAALLSNREFYNSNTISVFRFNVSLKTTTEKSLCIKSWITCLVVITESLSHWRSRVSAAQAKSQRGAFPSLKPPQESFFHLPPFMLAFVSSVYSGRQKLLFWLQVGTVKKEHVYNMNIATISPNLKAWLFFEPHVTTFQIKVNLKLSGGCQVTLLVSTHHPYTVWLHRGRDCKP